MQNAQEEARKLRIDTYFLRWLEVRHSEPQHDYSNRRDESNSGEYQCSTKDQFCYRIGRMIAKGRALKNLA